MFGSAQQYDSDLAQGLNLSGESQEYFLQGRIGLLRNILTREQIRVESILDFGCGSGRSAPVLQAAFDATVFGYDTTDSLIAEAGERHGTDRIRFVNSMRFLPDASFDACYTNGVFHHIEPAARGVALAEICRVLKPHGVFAFFENNPWNPGTRLVMARIPFDRDAHVISFPEARTLLRSHGFETLVPPQFIFYFPKFLAFLRPLERLALRIPLGGQYLMLMRKACGG